MQKQPLNRFLAQIQTQLAPPDTPRHREEHSVASSLARKICIYYDGPMTQGIKVKLWNKHIPAPKGPVLF